ncbi:hypothetical protein [Winogradskyella aurantia]|nr:hypothetical protein [Winogradskyella aurantia]
MKYIIFYINLFLIVVVYGQDQFVIEENGLTPKFSITKIDNSTKTELYNKTLDWVNEHENSFSLSVDDTVEGEAIYLTSFKGNAVSLDKQFFNVKYDIRISFENEQFKFEPSEIKLKLNSKYDMGWKEFSLSNGDIYFKNGKVIRKYKRYIKDITAVLNEINNQLSAYLKKP